jgi:hypothetical protein
VFCQGGSVRLSANTGTALSYQWNYNHVGISGATYSSYTTDSPGTFNVIVTNSFGCTDTSAAVSVVVNALPVAGTITGTTTSNVNDTNTYTIAAQSGLSYTWSVTGGIIQSGQGTNSIKIKWTNKGTEIIKVSVMNINSCSDSSSLVVSVLNTGIAEINPGNFTIYPNPATNELIISNVNQNLKGSQLIISDMLGRAVIETTILNDTREVNLPVNNLQTGTYILTIQNGNEINRLKFVKK